MLKTIQTLATKVYPEVIDFRRRLHQHPELSFEEHETTRFICKQLEKHGVHYDLSYSDTGVVALLEGTNKSKNCIALRADIDALPIVENTGLPFASKHEGIMHACGHDVHAASLFGALLILNELKDDFQGSIKLIFQPGEELLPGGASVMIKNGVLENPKVDKIFGQHVFTELPVGMVGFRPGLYMASADELHTTITGRGGHAALAKDLRDPIVAMNHLLIELRKNIAAHNENDIPSVIGFGQIKADGATNIIPDVVKIKGTFRTMQEDWRMKAHEIMTKTATEVADRFDVTIDLGIKKGYPCLLNDEQVTLEAKKLAVEYLGEENVVDLPIRMSSEDFSFYTHNAAGCFYRLGTSNSPDDLSTPVHTSTFQVNEQALKIGSGLMAWIAYNQARK